MTSTERARKEAERIFAKREDELSDLLIALADSAMSDLDSYQQRAQALEAWIQNLLATELEPLFAALEQARVYRWNVLHNGFPEREGKKLDAALASLESRKEQGNV